MDRKIWINSAKDALKNAKHWRINGIDAWEIHMQEAAHCRKMAFKCPK